MKPSQKIRKGENTRQKISRSTSKLLDEKGYFGTGINDILYHAKAPKGSMYFHFPGGKEEVATRAITDTGAEIAALLTAALSNTDKSEVAISSIFGYFKMRLLESDFKCGCPVSTVGLELSGTNSTTLMACSKAYSSWVVILQNYLMKFLPGDQAIELADAIFSLIQGALLVSRINGDITHLENAEVLCNKLVGDTIRQVELELK